MILWLLLTLAPVPTHLMRDLPPPPDPLHVGATWYDDWSCCKFQVLSVGKDWCRVQVVWLVNWAGGFNCTAADVPAAQARAMILAYGVDW